MKKLIIFDFDGTLADTADCITKTMMSTLKSKGLPTKTTNEIQNVIGLPLDKCFETLLGNSDEEIIKECCAEYRATFPMFQQNNIRLFDKVKETLQALKSKGLHLAIASSRSVKSLNELSILLGIEDFIEAKMASDLVENKKPAPDMVLNLLKQYGTNPEEALVIGDTIYDIEMGQNAGCDTCGVTYGNQTRMDLEKQKPTYIIDDISELTTLIDVRENNVTNK